MIFKERQKRAMDTMNHRNKEYLEKMNGCLLYTSDAADASR